VFRDFWRKYQLATNKQLRWKTGKFHRTLRFIQVDWKKFQKYSPSKDLVLSCSGLEVKNHILTNSGKKQQQQNREILQFYFAPKIMPTNSWYFQRFPPKILQIIALAYLLYLLCWAPLTEKPAVSTCLAAKACKFLHRPNPYFQVNFGSHICGKVRFHQWQKPIGFLRMYKPCNFDKLDLEPPMTSVFEGKPPKTRSFPIKTRIIWVLGTQHSRFLGSICHPLPPRGQQLPPVLSLGPEQTTTSRPGVVDFLLNRKCWGIWWWRPLQEVLENKFLAHWYKKNMGIKFEEFAIFKSARGHGLVPRRVYLSFRCVENKGRIQSLWQQNWLTSLWLNHPSEQNIFVKLDRFPRVKGRRNDWRRHLVDAYGFQLGSSLMFLPLAERGKKQIPNAWYTFFTIYPSNGGRISLIDLIVIYGANAI